LKKLVGRKGIEDAIQRLEKVTVQEVRIAAAEVLNGLHAVDDKVMSFDLKNGIQSTPKALDAGVKAVRETPQGTVVRAKGTRNKAINGTSTISDRSCPSLSIVSMLIPLGVEKRGRQIATGFPMTAESSKAVNGLSDNGPDRAEELRGVWNRARNPTGEGARRDFVAETVDGKQVILPISHPHHTECLVCLDVKSMSTSTESNSAYRSCS
jgi:hypothetical protein